MSGAFHTQLRAELITLRDPVRAKGQRAYMKSEMPYLGIPAPVLRRVTRQQIKEHPFASQQQWLAAVLDVWQNARYRELRYSTIQLAGAQRYAKWLDLAAVPVLEEMVVDGAWWDYVDSLATNHFGTLLRNHPTPMKKLMRTWSRDDDMWRRRVAILIQLKFTDKTDERLLRDVMKPSIREKEFFLRKAIGWALREYSKTSPDFVIRYVNEHADTLSGLSKREAFKVMLKQSTVRNVP
ncbi:MAG: DNA alkylation repair protein [Pseudomonadales bacterium]|jgi:3-methyladenine DNA glycosylase AlkD|nr:DNA alkylation repair protein [Pseudomonadales bacterium]MDP6470704.1 DNA alkylation repair protein [Pseudomonadales bacterium]MDP6828344.1 DNA alkylation repair protein [Pseudomonadales bacterium]MDP6972106.1 DNA alkylation repair protein [Pseudomonadales bacterium]|tara:strand:- start:380 stop:1093 length:714 start_codon:yes stop_codon:yes gene_type:complete